MAADVESHERRSVAVHIGAPIFFHATGAGPTARSVLTHDRLPARATDINRLGLSPYPRGPLAMQPAGQMSTRATVRCLEAAALH